MALVHESGFLDNLLQELAVRIENTPKPHSIDITNLDRIEVIELARDAIWDHVPIQGLKREIIDFDTASTEKIKQWLVKHYA